MRHKWKKLELDHPPHIKDMKREIIYLVFKPMECVQCGLKKGMIRSDNRFGNEIAYFKDGNYDYPHLADMGVMLSLGRLPYVCYETPNGMFITKEDFEI